MNTQKLKNLLKDPRTNWKYIAVVAILAFIVGAVIMNCLSKAGFEIPNIVLPAPINNEDTDARLLAIHYRGIDCAYLVGETVRPGNDIIESRKQLCASERAWFENNPSFCRLHSDPNHCFTWMAIKLKDITLCNEQKVEKDNCIRLVETTKNEDTWHWDYIRRNQNPI